MIFGKNNKSMKKQREPFSYIEDRIMAGIVIACLAVAGWAVVELARWAWGAWF
jgi:hypothetical protein